MKAFELHDARSVGEAVALLDRLGPTARVVAGGSDLVAGQMKDWVQGKGMPYPEHLVDVVQVPEMQGIRVGPGGAAIGANTTLTDIVESAELRRGWPSLVASAESVAR